MALQGLGIIPYYITIGNSKANGQVKRMIKDCIQCGLTKEPASFWINHLVSTLQLLYMTVNWIMGIALFLFAIGYPPFLPSLAIPGLPLLPNQPTMDKEEAYLTKFSYIVTQL